MTETYFSLGYLLNNQSKLIEAEQMYQRALQGYEKSLSVENITTYIPALNTIWNLGSLYKDEIDLVKARIIYLKALAGYEKVFGPNYPKSHRLRDSIRALDNPP
jgi:hypothetical protein